jgi:hypothetical protein
MTNPALEEIDGHVLARKNRCGENLLLMFF